MSVIHPHKGKLALSVFGGSLKKRSIVEENVATIDKERKKVRYEKKMNAN